MVVHAAPGQVHAGAHLQGGGGGEGVRGKGRPRSRSRGRTYLQGGKDRQFGPWNISRESGDCN